MPPLEITITGEVWNWGDNPSDELEISESEVDEYETRGYSIFELQGRRVAVKDLSPDDGDITIQPKSDMLGRFASAGNHYNCGLSGYFKGYVFLQGKRRRLVDFWTLFPDNGHHYASQTAKGGVENAIRAKVASLANHKVFKVAGGFAFDPTWSAREPKEVI